MARRIRFHLFAAFLLPPAAAYTHAAEMPANNVPAYPASLHSNCTGAGCTDTLRENHDVTFNSRLAFPVGSALLTSEARAELLRLLVELESFGIVQHVEIIGHADPSGPDDFNRWISERRASRVQDYFAQSGVDPRKMSIRGAGSSEPLAGAIESGEHRRLEVRVRVRPFL